MTISETIENTRADITQAYDEDNLTTVERDSANALLDYAVDCAVEGLPITASQYVAKARRIIRGAADAAAMKAGR